MKVLYISLLLLIVDQVTKFLVKGGTIPILNIKAEGMLYGDSINVIGDFFKITFVENPGLAFGIDVNDTTKLFLSLFSLIASVGIFFYLYKLRREKLVIRLGLALILAGAFGNFIDRAFYGLFYGYAPLFYGKVVDFFNVDFFDFTILGKTYERWPIFNIADASVTIGVLLLILFHRTAAEQSREASQVIPAAASDPAALVGPNVEPETADRKELSVISSDNGENNIGKEDKV